MTRLYWEARRKVKNPEETRGVTTGQANQLAQILQFSAKLMSESEPMEELRELKKEHKAALDKLARLEAMVAEQQPPALVYTPLVAIAQEERRQIAHMGALPS